jgi:AICAR transformylase/IMP cyclohydrolase PurH
MNRTALTDGSGKWFDMDSAEKFSENTQYNGSNKISMVTHSQWDHEDLYRTASGTWVLNRWSQMQGKLESYEHISDAEAAAWLMVNEYDNSEIPESLLPLLENDINNLEL